MNLDIRDRNTQLGLALVAIGALALFSNLGIFAGFGRLVGLLMFGAAGVVVLRAYGHGQSEAWALPVGAGLIGLGLASLDMPWGGPVFLAAIGVGFVMVFQRDETRWWAIIPAGVLLTLGATAAYDEWLFPSGAAGATVFFLGLAVTFAALYLMPQVNQAWAIWPALALGVVGVLSFSFRGGWLLPLILIVVGVWLLTRQVRPTDVNGGLGPVPPGVSPGERQQAPGGGEHAGPPQGDAATDAQGSTVPRDDAAGGEDPHRRNGPSGS
ncbi:MAG: hypothetical protein U5K81_01210 [Trueperaceae bacterium]|nr:hypothetical protein [Trueperaceae bacterium]